MGKDEKGKNKKLAEALLPERWLVQPYFSDLLGFRSFGK